jgi:hypothetical protein
MLKELEDYTWFNKNLRRWQMDFIGSVANWANLYQPLEPVLQQLLANNNCTQIQDLCSGSGQPTLHLYKRLNKKIPLVLSDKFPDENFSSHTATYLAQQVDVTQMQPQKSTCYTMYNAFHHFSSVTQIQIVKNMAMTNSPFLFAEILHPGILNIIKIFFTTTIIQLFVAPFINPFSLTRLFFTYIIPINLFTITFDGIISVLKSKTKNQYENLLATTSGDKYIITVNSLKTTTATIVYIMGRPLYS